VPRRSESSRPAFESLVPHERAFRRTLADEVAIDFPSSKAAIEYVRRDQFEHGEVGPPVSADLTISPGQAVVGAIVALDVDVPRTCASCGGRGEVWDEPCAPCGGIGHQVRHERLTVAVPAGVSTGDRFSFTIVPPRGPRTRVDVRVAVTP